VCSKMLDTADIVRDGDLSPALSDFKTFWLIGSNCIPVICARLRLEGLTVVQSDVSLWNVHGESM